MIEAAGIVAIALIAWAMSREPGGIIAAIPVLGALALGAQRLLPLLHQTYASLSHSAGAFRLLADVIALVEAPVADDQPPGEGAELAFEEAIVFELGLLSARGRQLRASQRRSRDSAWRARRRHRSHRQRQEHLLDLLMGLLAPDSGAVRIDGRALDAATRALWQAKIAHVPQSVYLADDSIAANIAFGVEPEVGRSSPARGGLRDRSARRVHRRPATASRDQRRRYRRAGPAVGVAPFEKRGDVSFILDKNKVDEAKERMRVEQARYVGEDNKGQKFVIVADHAVQQSSNVPVVDDRGDPRPAQPGPGPARDRRAKGTL